jgi:hypothetical protein
MPRPAPQAIVFVGAGTSRRRFLVLRFVFSLGRASRGVRGAGVPRPDTFCLYESAGWPEARARARSRYMR